MFFTRNSNIPVPSIEEEIELLSNRLEGSIYYEDKISTLNALLEISKSNPVPTGTQAMITIVNSIKEMDDISIQIEILENIFSCVYKIEFIDILLQNLDCLVILCECFNEDKNIDGVYNLLCKLTISPFFADQMLKVPSIAHYCTVTLNSERTKLISCLIKSNYDFKKQMVFEGIFENILSLLSTNPSHNLLNILDELLIDNTFNQNYFSSLNLKIFSELLKLKPLETFKTFTSLLDLKNIEIKTIQKVTLGIIDLNEAFEYRQWLFIYLVIYENINIIDLFTKEILKIDELVKDANTNQGYLLITYLIRKNHIKEFKTEDFKINILKSILGYETNTNLLLKEAEKNIKSQNDKLIFESLVFIIFNMNENIEKSISKILITFFTDYTRKTILRGLSLVILIMLEIPKETIEINYQGVLYYLKQTRTLLSNIDLDSEFYLTDEVINLLLGNINELIVGTLEKIELEDDKITQIPILKEEAKKEQMEATNTPVSPLNSMMSFFKTKDEDGSKKHNNPLNSVMSFFKQKEDKEDEEKNIYEL